MAKPKVSRVRAKSGKFFKSNSPQGRSIIAAGGGTSPSS